MFYGAEPRLKLRRISRSGMNVVSDARVLSKIHFMVAFTKDHISDQSLQEILLRLLLRPEDQDLTGRLRWPLESTLPFLTRFNTLSPTSDSDHLFSDPFAPAI